jgi:peptidylprolyl isomerase/peptidyl-prolyl cis-trans isomerase B (cyclophilin B)
MARTSDPDSAGSQFYICYGPQPHLDGQYTVFGEVTEGMELIDKVHNGSVIRKATLLP